MAGIAARRIRNDAIWQRRVRGKVFLRQPHGERSRHQSGGVDWRRSCGLLLDGIANGLSQAGHVPTQIQTTATVHFDRTDKGFGITNIELNSEADVPGIDEATFSKIAEEAKQNCPVSKALTGTQITLKATLKSATRA